jgi:hypothetical protein
MEILGSLVMMEGDIAPQNQEAVPVVCEKRSASTSKGQSCCTRDMQMVTIILEKKGVIHTTYVPRGNIVNPAYIMKALARSLVVSLKRLIMASQDWFLSQTPPPPLFRSS